MPHKKIGIKGLGLNSQAKAIIYNVTTFMEQEAAHFKTTENLLIPLSKLTDRILAATGISKNTLTKIRKGCRDVNKNGATSLSFKSPKRKRCRSKKIELSSGQVKTIKNIIYDLYTIEKRSPTINGIYQKLKNKQMEFPGSKETLRKTIIGLGFR
ncbi:uncharacterized protein LOC126890025 [Diabrotica virgifera virgifera]|uniref:Uncharacterized protein n=1 Tax=Diabrotica virgifera virgifera TaxID=50390 RepID=A0ABM5KX78_DIAVI|nr:uncharacterized protein LOC126890025 [Diabrotica virgifera virgifera]